MEMSNTPTLVKSEADEAANIFSIEFGKAGLSDERARALNKNPDFVRYLAAGIDRFSRIEPYYDLARSILGKDFISPEDITRTRADILYSTEQAGKLAESLPPQEMLLRCKRNGYVVMPMPPTPLSLLEIHGDICCSHFFLRAGKWYAYEDFARKEKTSFGWLLIKKKPLKNSNDRNWEKQLELLSEHQWVPRAVEMVWFTTIYFEVNNARLFERLEVRTSSQFSTEKHVCVGHFDDHGLWITYDHTISNPRIWLTVALR